jgi:hypothetical protein
VPFSMESTSTFASPPAWGHQNGLAAKFAPLISIISMLGNGNLDTLVDYVAVREEMMNHRDEFDWLGWSFTKLSDIVELAHQERVIEAIKIDGAIKFLKLLHVPQHPNEYPSSNPRPLHVPQHPNEYPSSSRPRLEKFVPLVSLVLQQSGLRLGYKVRLGPVCMAAGIKEIKQFMTEHGWPTVEAWIHDACLAGALEQGHMKICGKWVMVPMNVGHHVQHDLCALYAANWSII